MRKIELLENLSLRFPNRSDDFDEGVELGVIATLMAFNERSIERTISASALEQVRDLAERFRYRIARQAGTELIELTLEPIGSRPSLRLVQS